MPFRQALGLRPTDAQARDVFVAARMLLMLLGGSYCAYEVSAATGFLLGESISLVLFWVVLLLLFSTSSLGMFREGRSFLQARTRCLLTGDDVQFVVSSLTFLR